MDTLNEKDRKYLVKRIDKSIKLYLIRNNIDPPIVEYISDCKKDYIYRKLNIDIIVMNVAFLESGYKFKTGIVRCSICHIAHGGPGGGASGSPAWRPLWSSWAGAPPDPRG